MLNCFCETSFGQLCLGIKGQVVQFQCRLFLLVQALIFGDHVGSLELSCGHYVLCLVVLAGFAPCMTGANHCRLRHVGWECVDMDLPQG